MKIMARHSRIGVDRLEGLAKTFATGAIDSHDGATQRSQRRGEIERGRIASARSLRLKRIDSDTARRDGSPAGTSAAPTRFFPSTDSGSAPRMRARC